MTILTVPGVIDAFVDGARDLPVVTKENPATRALAMGLADAGIDRFWTAHTIHASLPGAATSRGLRLTKLYDLAWGDAESADPAAITQVKLGNKTQEDQEFLWFLGDIVFAALDRHLQEQQGNHLDAIVVAFVPNGRKCVYWNRIVSETGKLTLEFRPCEIATELSAGPGWIDQEVGHVAPTARSVYQKIFGVGTSAKFVGLFNRPGVLEISAAVGRVNLTNNWMIWVSVESLTLSGTEEPIERWWP